MFSSILRICLLKYTCIPTCMVCLLKYTCIPTCMVCLLKYTCIPTCTYFSIYYLETNDFKKCIIVKRVLLKHAVKRIATLIELCAPFNHSLFFHDNFIIIVAIFISKQLKF